MKFENLQDRIIELRGQSVLLDADVAEIYGVETKRLNEAVKNNPDKFPAGYIIELDNRVGGQVLQSNNLVCLVDLVPVK